MPGDVPGSASGISTSTHAAFTSKPSGFALARTTIPPMPHFLGHLTEPAAF